MRSQNEKTSRLHYIARPLRPVFHRLLNTLRAAMRSICSLPRVARNAIARLLVHSDYARWSNPTNLEEWWETRSQKVARHVPARATVLELGAGSCRLRKHLEPSCNYIPSDIVNRGDDTVLCDLNQRPLPDLRYLHANVAVFTGVLEYIGDTEAVAAWLSQLVALCVVSYDPVPQGLKLFGRLRERFRRLYYGYMSDLTEDQLVQMFRRHGFVNTAMDTWTSQRILVFARESAAVSTPLSGKVASMQRHGITR
jgi:hypothetical protein